MRVGEGGVVARGTGMRATARLRGATVPERRGTVRSPISARAKRRRPCSATSVMLAARTGAVSARSVARGDAAEPAEMTGAGGVPMPISTAAAPAAPPLIPGETLPSQAKKRCGAAVANADHATVGSPR